MGPELSFPPHCTRFGAEFFNMNYSPGHIRPGRFSLAGIVLMQAYGQVIGLSDADFVILFRIKYIDKAPLIRFIHCPPQRYIKSLLRMCTNPG